MVKFNQSLLLSNAYDESLYLGEKTLDRAKSALATGELKVAIIGDSVSEGSDVAFKEYNLSGMLEKALKDKFGSKINFKNYAVGGTDITTFLDTSYVPSRVWNDKKISWLECVKSFSPDLLIVAFGVNSLTNERMREYEYYLNSLETHFSSKSVILVNNLELGNEESSSSNNKILNNIAKTQYNYAKNQNNNFGCINAHRLYCLITRGIDEYSFEGHQQPMWAGGNTSQWTAGGGVRRVFTNYENRIEVTSNTPSSAMLRHNIHSQDVCMEGTYDLSNIALTSSNSNIIFVARENGSMPHVIGVIIKVTIHSNKDITVSIGTAKEAMKKYTYGSIPASVSEIFFRIGMIEDKAFVDCRYNTGYETKTDRILEHEIPKAVFKGSPYVQFENLNNLKIQSPAFFYSVEKKCDVIAPVAHIYGPSGEPNGGNGINHPSDHAFPFLFSKAVKDLVNSL